MSAKQAVRTPIAPNVRRSCVRFPPCMGNDRLAGGERQTTLLSESNEFSSINCSPDCVCRSSPETTDSFAQKPPFFGTYCRPPATTRTPARSSAAAAIAGSSSAARRERGFVMRRKYCPICGVPFVALRSTARYCSPACKQKIWRAMKKLETPLVKDTPAAVTLTIAEPVSVTKRPRSPQLGRRSVCPRCGCRYSFGGKCSSCGLAVLRVADLHEEGCKRHG